MRIIGKEKPFRAKVFASCGINNAGRRWILRIEDADSSTLIVEVTLDDAAFSAMLAHHMDGSTSAGRLFDTTHVGQQMETKQVGVECSEGLDLDEIFDRAEQATPGWTADRDKRWNQHRFTPSTRTKGRTGTYAVFMRRWVDRRLTLERLLPPLDYGTPVRSIAPMTADTSYFNDEGSTDTGEWAVPIGATGVVGWRDHTGGAPLHQLGQPAPCGDRRHHRDPMGPALRLHRARTQQQRQQQQQHEGERMSHFTVLVRISKEKFSEHGGLATALDAMMEPYNENVKDEKYLAFEDDEDEYRKKYAEASVEMWRSLETGERFYTWDSRFKSDVLARSPDAPPTGYQSLDVPFREKYATFEEYMADFCGYERRDPKTGRYGHWHNPHGYWDCWTIVGRWSGFFPLRPEATPRVGEPGAFGNKAKPGHGDVITIADLDLPALRKQQAHKAREFWKAWNEWLKNPRDDSWDTGIRPRALDLGLLRVVEGPHEPSASEVAVPWTKLFGDRRPDPNDLRVNWTDVATKLTEEEFLAKYEACFHPLITYAALDENGWHQPGKMGWWGVSHAEPGSKADFRREFVRRFIDEAKPTDTLVLVDCHV